MKIIVEKNIPYIQGLLEPFGTVDYLSANEITADTVRDADALFVRTRTKCNAALLEGSRVKFIATATIGTDHIDLPYCREKGITVRNAPGCNAPAVAQYVFATIARWMEGKPMSPRELTLGVVGVGNVGKIIVRWARNLGFNVLECDPPRQRAEEGSFVALDDIARTGLAFHQQRLVHLYRDVYRQHKIIVYYIFFRSPEPIIVVSHTSLSSSAKNISRM